MRFFFLYLFISFTHLAAATFDLETGYHHIEPLLKEVEEVLSESPASQCSDPPVSIGKYISELPKTEAWRSYYKLPKILGQDNLLTPQQICDDAKKENEKTGQTKKYALIAHKTHLCDAGGKACLSTLKSVSDPCNYFVQDNFQVYHTRTFIGPFRTKNYDQLLNLYGAMGPSLLVIDLSTCNFVPTVNAQKYMQEQKKTLAQATSDGASYTGPHPENARDEKDLPKFKSSREEVRFEAMRESLLTNMPQLQAEIGSKPIHCIENGQRSLPGLADDQEITYGSMTTKGILGVRKLMDEQYVENFGLGPFIKASK